jgi:hypothetical protein
MDIIQDTNINDQFVTMDIPDYPVSSTGIQQMRDNIDSSGTIQANLTNTPQDQVSTQVETMLTENNQNEQPQIIPANVNQIEQIIEKPKNAGGRPTKYSDEILRKTEEYFQKSYGKVDGKFRIPFIEELALELNVDEDTVVEWMNKKNDDSSLVYPEFSATYRRIFLLQKLRLKQAGLRGKSQSFIIFLLNSNHGMVSAEKQILTGEKTEPLQITIVEEKPLS